MFFNAEKGRFRLSPPESPSWGIMLNLKDLFTSVCGDCRTPGEGSWCPSFPVSGERRALSHLLPMGCSLALGLSVLSIWGDSRTILSARGPRAAWMQVCPMLRCSAASEGR